MAFARSPIGLYFLEGRWKPALSLFLNDCPTGDLGRVYPESLGRCGRCRTGIHDSFNYFSNHLSLSEPGVEEHSGISAQ